VAYRLFRAAGNALPAALLSADIPAYTSLLALKSLIKVNCGISLRIAYNGEKSM